MLMLPNRPLERPNHTLLHWWCPGFGPGKNPKMKDKDDIDCSERQMMHMSIAVQSLR